VRCLLRWWSASVRVQHRAEFRSTRERLKLDQFARELWTVGRKLFLFFLGFTTIGYLAIEAIPTSWLTGYLGDDSLWSVPSAAFLGIPTYVNTEASLPLVATLMDGGWDRVRPWRS